MYNLIFLAIVALAVSCHPHAIDKKDSQNTPVRGPETPLPAPTGFVNDYTGVLDTTTKQHLESTLTRLKERSAIEFAIACVDSTGGLPINEYSLAVAHGWRIGPKDKTKGGGLLLLIAINDRAWRIEVSKSLETDLPDEVALKLGQPMKGFFQKQQYGSGVINFVDAIIARLAERRGFSMQ